MSAQNENTQDSPWKDIPLEATVLGRTILRKLGEKQKKSNALFFLGVLKRLQDERQRPHVETDIITNPMNSSESKKNGLYTAYTTVAEKRALYNRAIENGAVAYIGFQQSVPLGSPGADFNDVEFIAGLWRVQKKFPYEITNVRDREFVLVKKLPHHERTKFDFYAAAAVTWGGNGGSADIAHPDWVVARYKTNRGIYMAYGRTIEQARAFLGIKLYDEYQDLIDAEIRPNTVVRENSK